MNKFRYSKEELYSTDGQRTFDSNCSEVAFLLGGIGTGNFSIGSRGDFRDWEIFNRPNKGMKLPYTFFAIWVKEEDRKAQAKVLESRLTPPFSKSHGYNTPEVAGLPRFAGSKFRGEYPFAWVTFEDDTLPVEVTLEAFTPLIPLNADDSGIPCAILKYKVKNISDNTCDVTIAGSLPNMSGFNGFNIWGCVEKESTSGDRNAYRIGENFRGLYFYSTSVEESSLRYGDMSLATVCSDVTVRPEWFRGRFTDGIQDMWDDFSSDGRLEYETRLRYETDKKDYGGFKVGSLGICNKLAAGEEKEFTFILTWNFPNRRNSWSQDCCETGCCETDCCGTVRNYYATLFKNSWETAAYVVLNFERLYSETCKFHDALFQSTLPSYVIDAAASNIGVIRSTTCFRLENGKFFGWEGCFDNAGCCEGNCTHVWNYAQTLAFLFPSLERDMRYTEFNIETEETGKMNFRTLKPFGGEFEFHPAADGQLGCIIRLYRDWKLCGDNDFLKSVWQNAKKVLDYAFEYWDSDGDCVLDNQQHNTYDIEFYGPNSLVNSMFYGALKAGAEMAEAMGDQESSARYKKALEKGSVLMDRMLWNGDYYIQVIGDIDKYKYQYGTGCLSDQLLGQLLCHVAGLGYILPEKHVKKAVKSIFKHNFLTDFTNHNSVQRTYVLNDEKGLVLCSWPKGGRPKLPFIYSDEVWTGIEYQVAAHLIYEGFIEEGLTIVRAVRERHDGIRRNPWNEVECGNHYARSMASWAVLTALSGFKCDLVEGIIEFDPAVSKENFSCFFSCGRAWGVFTQRLSETTGKYEYKVDVLYGSLHGIKIKVNGEVIDV